MSIVRNVPRENSTANTPTKTTNRNVPTNDTEVVNTSVPPPAPDSDSIVTSRPETRPVAGAAETRTITADPTVNTNVVRAVMTRTRRRSTLTSSALKVAIIVLLQ